MLNLLLVETYHNITYTGFCKFQIQFMGVFNNICEALCYDAKHFFIASSVETCWFRNMIGLHVFAMSCHMNMYVHKCCHVRSKALELTVILVVALTRVTF